MEFVVKSEGLTSFYWHGGDTWEDRGALIISAPTVNRVLVYNDSIYVICRGSAPFGSLLYCGLELLHDLWCGVCGSVIYDDHFEI